MKKSSIIIAVVAILVIAGIAVGVYFATKSEGDSTTREFASNSDPLRSGSILDRLRAEQEAGLYSKKKGDNAEEGTA